MRARVRQSFLALTISPTALFSLVQEAGGGKLLYMFQNRYDLPSQSAAVPQACLEMKPDISIEI